VKKVQWSWHPVLLSFFVATIATVITFIIAISLTLILSSKKIKGKSIMEMVIYMPLVLPPTVIGFFLIILFGKNSLAGKLMEWFTGQNMLFTVPAAIIAGGVVVLPLVYQSIKTGFSSIDPDILHAAKVDGATPIKAFWYIILPLSRKYLLAGVILGYTRAFGEFGATLMVAGNIPGKTQTVPTAIFLAIETGNMRLAWYYVCISLAFSFILLTLVNQLKKD
jgi:molybdate transport system permease protein